MSYCIVKRFRTFNGEGYSGYTCFLAGIEPGRVYENLEEASTDANKLSEINPVGFVVVDNSSGAEARPVDKQKS